MSIIEIKNNINKFDTKTKDELIIYVNELLIYEKRQDSKIMSLKTEIKYLTRHLTKVRDLINKTLDANANQVNTWKETKPDKGEHKW